MTVFIVGFLSFVAGVILTLLFRIPVENKLKAEKAQILAGIKNKL